jgi:DNA-binding CsgD family transcriptional regulator
MADNGAVDLRERVQRLAAGSGNLTAMRSGLDRLLRAVIGYDAAALSTMDPATKLWTSCFVTGLPPNDGVGREQVIFDIEFRGNDVNSYAALSEADQPIGRLHDRTGGDLGRAERFGRLLEGLGVVDEMRVVLRARGSCWGSLTMYRIDGAPPFSARDEAVVASAVPAITDLFRLTLLRAALDAPRPIESPPGLLLFQPDGSTDANPAASAWLDAIDDRGRLPSVMGSVVAAARAGDGLARATIPARDGRWVELHGSVVPSAAASAASSAEAVAVIIEGARPAVLGEVIAEAYGFTPRERDITALAARGRTTKQMALDLGISPFTVQDHLKAVFAKTGTQTRGELVATIFVQHYEPRRAAQVTPSPYGWYLDEELTA